jgi:uncharacterized protein (DUF1499 family)
LAWHAGSKPKPDIPKENAGMKFSHWIWLLLLLLPALTPNCSGVALQENRQNFSPMADCPERPNCVSSEAQDHRRLVEAFRLRGADQAAAWNAVVRTVTELPRSSVIQATDRYLHVIYKSRLFGFIDDLELQLAPETGRIAVRSAARSGYYDLGVNRRRVEALRLKLKKLRLIH